jgi:hypothetical protein
MKLFLYSLLILLLIPMSQAYSQEYSDNASTLTVSLSSQTPFVYQNSEGYTVVVGMVENNNPLSSVTSVQIQINFFDDYDSSPLEVVHGSTTLEMIAPNEKSPYSIRSETPNLGITQVSVSLLGFDSSEEKQKGLTVYSTDVFLDDLFRFSGVLQTSGAPNSDTRVYLAFYDGFEPPRILRVATIELGDVEPNTEVVIDFNEKIDSRSVGFLLFAESDVFGSDFIDIEIPPSQVPTKLVTISDVFIEDSTGNTLSELEVGSQVNIKSKTLIQFAADQPSNETAYTYYVQVKESGKVPYVEYIGKFDGRFIGNGQETQTLDWIPEKTGLYFIETFVWDRNNVPIAEQGPFVLIVVN